MRVQGAKADLRRAILARRGEASEEERARWNAAIERHLFETLRWRKASGVLAYCSFPDEVATGRMLRTALAEGKRLFLPRVVRGEKRFEAVEVHDLERDLAATSFRGLVEPMPSLPADLLADAVDLILVPGIAFDRRGYRLGFGAGMYDRFLADHPTPFRLALAYQLQVLDVLPNDGHDMPVHAILTETGWLDTGTI